MTVLGSVLVANQNLYYKFFYKVIFFEIFVYNSFYYL